jgi:outer membrane protein assembly factor BamB
MRLTFKTTSKQFWISTRLYSLFAAMNVSSAAKRMTLAVTLGGGLVGNATRNAAADWPEFRGPNQNGTIPATKAPAEWSEEKNIVWYTPTQGLGWSSPVVVGDRIFITSARNTDSGDAALAGPQALHLECYSVKTGKPIFDRMLIEQPKDAPSIHKKNSHASPTVLANDGRLFVHFGHQGTVCTDLEGKILWRNLDHSYSPVHGNGGSPILFDKKLFLTCDGGDTAYTLALDAATGKEVWRTPRGITTDRPFSFCTPQAIQVDGAWQIISPGSDIVQSLDPETGNVIWSVSYEGFSVVPRPIYYRGLVFVCTGYMTPKLLAIDPTGKGDVTDTHVRWTYGTGVPNTPSIVPVGDQIVMVSDGGVASGVSVETGKKIWQKRLGGNYSASPIAIGKQVYFQSEAGDAIVMEIGDEPKEISRATLPGRVFASYAWLDGDWIIRAENGLYRIGER